MSDSLYMFSVYQQMGGEAEDRPDIGDDWVRAMDEAEDLQTRAASVGDAPAHLCQEAESDAPSEQEAEVESAPSQSAPSQQPGAEVQDLVADDDGAMGLTGDEISLSFLVIMHV